MQQGSTVTGQFSSAALGSPAVPAILIGAARCWRDARDCKQSVQPCLARTLVAHDCTMLAPVLDSLCLFYEASLGRRMTVGEGQNLSADEHLLLGLVDGSRSHRCINCSHSTASALDCALCSTRIMLALTLDQPVPRPRP